MPAVTADTLTLPRLDAVSGIARPVRSVTYGPKGHEGEGFPVTRAFAGVTHQDLDPFIHMDQMGEVEYQPYEPRGTSWHPHRGFETFTYMIDGTFLHQDNHGGDVKLISSHDGGALIRVIAGEIGGHEGPGKSQTPMTIAHITLAPGASVSIPWNPEFNALAYALAGAGSVGEGELGATRAPIETGGLAVFGAGDRLVISAGDVQDARHGALDILLLGGKPIKEPVFAYGPFVMNDRQGVIDAMEDFNYGRFGVIPEDAIQPFHYKYQ